ncbi:MAG: germination protein YpeB, partial [Clostridiales bacterium]|jgi:germination protein YpeB|nr:germination protein YpeB [Clostridiales bacterium]
MSEIEKGFAEYASLIYDGPFSQHMRDKEPIMTKDAPKITADDAKAAVMNFLGADKVRSVDITGEGGGKIPTYVCRAVTDDGDREITAEVTKNGGYILFVLDNRVPETAALDIAEAAARAREFLASRGYDGMRESYFQREGNTVVINYAYRQGDFVMYTDLIKVKIALDHGEMIGFEAYGYINNHVAERPLPEIAVSEQDARAKVRGDVAIGSVGFARIPLENGQEVYCYELRGTRGGKNYLVYVNVENGAEEQILLLLENDNGTLTI